MKFLKIVLMLLASQAAFGKAFDYRSYCQMVNKAELAITEGRYAQALACYNKAFEMKEKPFVQDLYNASICAVKENRLKDAMRLCNRLAAAGVGGKFLGGSIYKPLAPLKGWGQLVRVADLTRDRYLRDNQKLLHILDSMSDKDQKVNQVWRQAGYGMGTPERQKMDMTYDTLSGDLYRLMEKTGFISEQMIGAVLRDDTTLAYGLPYDIIMIHNYQSRAQGDTLFRTMLYRSLRQGLIQSEYLASLEDFGANIIDRPDYGTAHCYIAYNCAMYIDHYAKERMSALNANRKEIGMGGLDDALKKILYKMANPGTRFMLRANYIKYGSFANKESEDAFLRTGELIVKQIPGCR